jgi:hypothetical protein
MNFGIAKIGRRISFKISRKMLALSRSPLPRIGLWTLDTNGILQLTNRPLTLRLHQLENESIPINIGKTLTYLTTDAFYLDILSYHDNRIRYQLNSVNDEEDGCAQMANLTMMRTLPLHFMSCEFRNGPFVLKLH